MKKAIVLCSGGLDSITAAFHAKNTLGYKNIVLFFCNYNQRAYNGEKKSVKYFAQKLGAKFVECDVRWLDSVSTSMINKKSKPNKISSLKNTIKESANWYVPCRNLVFLSNALAFAESEYITNKIKYDIITGFKNDGAETFPDTTQEFTDKLNKISKTTTLVKSNILSPVIKMDKEDIVSLATKYKIPIEKSFSCYVGPKRHCGLCLACKLRQAGFYWANVKDKTNYAKIVGLA
jgi:7-cyano-7-deazaguanine synthase